MLLAAFVAVLSIIALGFALAWRSADQERLDRARKANCERIEALKKVVRPDPFDRVRTRLLLIDLNIDPDSERGHRLIDEAIRNNVRERRELAPSDC